MQYSLLLIYLLKLAIHCGSYHGVYAHFNKGGQKLAHLARKNKKKKKEQLEWRAAAKLNQTIL